MGRTDLLGKALDRMKSVVRLKFADSEGEWELDWFGPSTLSPVGGPTIRETIDEAAEYIPDEAAYRKKELQSLEPEENRVAS